MNKTGFGFLRLPRTADEKIDYEALNPLVDRFLSLGGRYFDTAYTYLGGLSEEAIRLSLVQRHPRESYLLATKLPGYKVKAPSENRVYFREQLQRCGVDFFDVYLLHWLNEKNYEIACRMEQFAFLQQLKKEGLAKKVGFSYHDGPALLDRILTEQPQIDYVQLQINYLDWESPALQARACYEVAVKHGKQVLVMEPVKGGTLARLPQEAQALLPPGSAAQGAIRFAASLPQVEIVLSGMNEMGQIEENMADLPPLSAAEQESLEKIAGLLRASTAVACTGCSYCTDHCPQGIPIPQYFALFNDYSRSPSEGWKMQHAYAALANTRAPADACLQCHACEANCPQGLPIAAWLQKAAEAFRT